MLNQISYLDDEIVDNDANYFLMDIDVTTPHSASQFKKIEISVSNDFDLEKTVTDNSSVLPLFCFQEENVSSIEELNFNNLKKCETNGNHKYMVVFLGGFYEKSQSNNILQNKFNEWNNEEPTVEIKLTGSNDENVVFWGNMLKIFYKEYQPTTT